MHHNGHPNTHQKLLRIRHLAEEGNSAIEIAKAVDSTPGSVRVFCSHHKIKIKRGRRRYVEIVTRLPASLYSGFHHKAEQVQMPVFVLASKLLAAIVKSDIYEAVLDDTDAH